MKLAIAKGLIQSGCVKLSPSEPFHYASGLKGPIYCDNRLFLSHVEFRNQVVNAFVNLIKDNHLTFDLIGGVATAGIPHAAFIADRLNWPMIYVRPKAKVHGKKNLVEGAYRANQSVVLVEDLVNQGSSLEDAIHGLESAQLQCSNCLCIVDYQMAESKKRLSELSLKLYSLTDVDHLLQAALELKFLDEKGKNLLMQWHVDPKQWSADVI